MGQDCNYFVPFGPFRAPMGPYRASKNDHRGHGSVHAKFQPVASHGDPFRANLVPSTLYQVLGDPVPKYLGSQVLGYLGTQVPKHPGSQVAG